VATSLQKSTEEHQHNTKLATTTYSEVLKLSDREDDNDQVEENVDAGRRPPEGVQTQAFPVVLAIPVVPSNANWDALQRSYENEDNDVQNAKHYCTPYNASKGLVRENAEVEEQD
jgi:hypothetical protein